MAAYYLSPIGNNTQTGTSGAPLSGGTINTYQAGTTTPQPTYTDNTGGTPQANPITLNTYGLPSSPIWLTGGQSYKFIIKDSLGNLVRTVDTITGINDPAVAYAVRVDVASGSVLDITGSASNTNDIRVTGTTTVASVNIAAGRVVRCVAQSAFTITNGAAIVTNTGADILVQAGDSWTFRATALNTVEVVGYSLEFGYATAGTTGKSMVRLNTANGYGSTNTKIRRLTNTVTSQGSDITYADSATLGASLTINAAGVYAVSYADTFSAAATLGLSLNTTTPTVSIFSCLASEQLGTQTTGGASFYGAVSWTGYLASGSVIRPHTDGAATGAVPGAVNLTITRVA